MPTYEYVCKECGDELEVVQKFTDDALTTCDKCSGPLRKVFGNVGISFKGSGFYKNDSRGSSSSKAASPSTETSAAASSDGSSSGSDSGTSGKSESSTAPASSPAPATTGSAAAS